MKLPRIGDHVYRQICDEIRRADRHVSDGSRASARGRKDLLSFCVDVGQRPLARDAHGWPRRTTNRAHILILISDQASAGRGFTHLGWLPTPSAASAAAIAVIFTMPRAVTEGVST